MDTQQAQEDSGRLGGNPSSFICRQTSSRWTPTTEQIRILKDLYYNNGVRSPSAEQIQRISARLRQYGKIEGKNVFYWFQNHKARERQKKRFTTADFPTQKATADTVAWKTDQDYSFPNKYQNITTPGFSSTLSYMGNHGYGSMGMEKSFKDGIENISGSTSHGLGMVGFDSYYSQPCNAMLYGHKRSTIDILKQYQDEEEEEEEEEEVTPEIETLPLFPMHPDDNINFMNGFCNKITTNNNNKSISNFHGQYYTNWYRSGGDHRNSALELSLTSYTGISPERY